MRMIRRAAVGAAAFALVTGPLTAASAGGGDDDGDHAVTVVAGALDGPRQVSDYRGDRLVVAESDSGELSSVDLHTGEVDTLVSGLVNPQGVDHHHGRLYIAVGESGAPEEGPSSRPSPWRSGGAGRASW